MSKDERLAYIRREIRGNAESMAAHAARIHNHTRDVVTRLQQPVSRRLNEAFRMESLIEA